MKTNRFVSALLWMVLAVLSVAPLLDMLTPGFPVTHDGQDHVARIANFYASLTEGNLVPRWASNLNWGYGHPILMFLYPLPSYIASVFKATGFSFVDSTKLVFAVGFMASVLSMYLFASYAWGRAAGFTAAVLYGFAPYRFVDLYVRGAIGEHVAFVFPPLVCYGLLRLARNSDRVDRTAMAVTASSVALLIASHNALSLLFLAVSAAYGLYLAVYEAKRETRFVFLSASSVFFGFLLSAFYWVPALLEGKYTLRDIVTAGEFGTRFVSWFQFIYSPWSYGGGNELSKWLGAGQLIAIAMSFFVLEKPSKYQRFLVASLLLMLLTLFLMTNSSLPIWNTVTLLQKFQFPWRLMSVTTFVSAVIGGVVIHELRKTRVWISVMLLCMSAVLTTVPMWRARAYAVRPESFFTGIYDSTTDTGESSPIWSVRFMEKRAGRFGYLVPDTGDVRLTGRTTTTRTYAVQTSGNARFVENTLYFPGWNVFVDGVALPQDKLIFQDPSYRGLMTFDLPPGSHTVEFRFTETKLRKVADAVSMVSGIMFILLIGTISLW